MKKPDHLIINNPYTVPRRHWKYDRQRQSFELAEGRRPAGYVMATPGYHGHDDPGVPVEIRLVNQIRPRVDAWRDAKYPGVSATTRALLEHWNDPEQREHRLFFCQLEAIETLVWLTEAPAAQRVGIEIPGDGGPFVRLCSKMATGSGKTIVMAMLIAWQVLNKAANNQDARFSKNVLVVAPGLTVRKRLDVLRSEGRENYYDLFKIVPDSLMQTLRSHGRIRIINWHKLAWESDEKIAKKKGVDKRGPRSDEAWLRDVLGEMAKARNLIVINDEAHHAWRIPEGVTVKGVSREEKEEATKWIGGLDRIHRARGILTCFDLSATPFVPSGKKSSEEALYGWIVSDFGLNDAIESGLVKTPRVVVRDDALPDVRTYKSKLYHIYAATDEHGNRIRDDLNRDAEPHEEVGAPPPPPPPTIRVEALPQRAAAHQIVWPQVVRIEHVLRPRLEVDWADVTTLQIDAAHIAQLAELAPTVDGKPDTTRVTEIQLRDLAERFRYQTLVFEAARKLLEEEKPAWRGSPDVLLGQLIQLVEQFLRDGRVAITPNLLCLDPPKSGLLGQRMQLENAQTC